MALLSKIKRIELGEGDWVEARPLTVQRMRELRQAVNDTVPGPGESIDEAQGFELTRLILEACLVAWSDDAEVTPENIALLPFDVSLDISNRLGLGERQVPLENGQDSIDT